jgi:hypothetical protein
MAGGKWKKRLDFAWFNFVRLFQWHRIIGLSALSVAAYFLFLGLRQTDVSWFLPREIREFHWPDLSPFFVRREETHQGRAKETIYTVPTRQITPQELAEVKAASVSKTK